MTLREILDYVVSTFPRDWHLIPEAFGREGPTHTSHAVSIDHPEVSLAWGLPLDDGLEFPDSGLAGRTFESAAADVRLHGVLVHRDSLLVVDHTYLPLGEWSGLPEAGAFVDEVTEWEYLFVKLLNDLDERHHYAERFDASQFIRVDGHPLPPAPPPRRAW